MKTALIGLAALIAAGTCSAEDMVPTEFAACSTIFLHKMFLVCMRDVGTNDLSMTQALGVCTEVVYLSDNAEAYAKAMVAACED